MSFSGKTALVTGATRGLGRVIALELGKQGATVVGTATTKEGAQKITDMLKAEGLKGAGYALQVQNTEAIADTLSAIQEAFSAPEILVNNAGITRDNIILRMKPEQWNEVINVNLNAVFHLTKACLKPMVKARWGRIINITSVVGVMGNFGQANYVAAKAGLIGFSKSVAKELVGYGITVNCVAPGFMETEMTDDLSDKHREAILAQIPMKRMGQAEDIAHAVAFLASDQATYITGETLHVNGGMCMV
ncbi:3-oxoacyl-ACP reductase FabG [Candidiatus Paracoxiella cheracis]|uniref:3-oxoacyl-ACP reductase FabG n=1 Tax=Candidiatus Paracoxiella cheracis TaxID=3405120 RepID=UPI003BF4A0A3